MPDQALCPGFSTARQQAADGCIPCAVEKQIHTYEKVGIGAPYEGIQWLSMASLAHLFLLLGRCSCNIQAMR